MSTFFKIYVLAWSSVCLYAISLYIKDRKSYAFSYKNYWRFLLKPWKVVTFISATILMTAVAPYSGDYTWDYYDAAFMAIMTFITAPWAVGILYKFRKGKAPFKKAFVAFCFWMFSASWSYDIYMFLREGEYPPTWLPNIVLSSILYLCAGLLWNLDWKKERGIFIAFDEDSWPTISKGLVFHKIFVATLPYILIVTFLCGSIIYGLNK